MWQSESDYKPCVRETVVLTASLLVPALVPLYESLGIVTGKHTHFAVHEKM